MFYSTYITEGIGTAAVPLLLIVLAYELVEPTEHFIMPLQTIEVGNEK